MARVSALFVFSMLILACGFDFGTARELPLKGVYSKLWRFQLNNRCVRGTGGRLLHDSRDVQLHIIVRRRSGCRIWCRMLPDPHSEAQTAP